MNAIRGWVKTMKICLSGNCQGSIAKAILKSLIHADEHYEFVDDDPIESYAANTESVDVAICTTGRTLIRDTGEVTTQERDYLYRGNFLLPVAFTERHIKAMRRDNRRGLIIHLGSNAGWYGNTGAVDYAVFKTALRKYLELRGREVRDFGIRMSLLGFGGVDTESFWSKATAGADPALTKTIVAGSRKPLTADEAAAVVLAAIRLPPNVVLRDALIVSTDYQ